MFVFLCLCLVGFSQGILNGDLVSFEVSWVVFVADNRQPKIPLATGTLVNPNYVLTSSCILKNHSAYNLIIAFGIVNAKKLEIGRNTELVIAASCFLGDFEISNLCLLKTYKKFQLSARLQAFEVPQTNIGLKTGQICQFYGWGMSKLPDPKDKNIEYSLRKSQMEIVKNEKCAAYGINLTENQFCAGKSLSPCQGDAGGPLMCQMDENTVLAGVLLHFSCKTGMSSFLSLQPSIFGDVSKLSKWILETIKMEEDLEFGALKGKNDRTSTSNVLQSSCPLTIQFSIYLYLTRIDNTML